MLPIQTSLEGKKAHFGYIREKVEQAGFILGGDWDYRHGYFDNLLWRKMGESIYLRLPFVVTSGELDQYDADIKFLKPFVIKHIVHVGLDYEEGSLLDATGFSQFQSPIQKDATIERPNYWQQRGGEIILKKFLPYVH